MSSQGAYVKTTALGSSGFDRTSGTEGNDNALSMFMAREITVTASTVFELQTWVENPKVGADSTGRPLMGHAINAGMPYEVAAQLTVTKLF